METKKWYASKTIIVGILEVIGGIVTALAGSIEAGVPITLAGIVQIIFRIITTTGVITPKINN
mgnify:CR=1 FL=1